MQDSLKAAFGITGTIGSALIANAEPVAAIFAGISTGVYMLVSAHVKLKQSNKPTPTNEK